VALGQRIWSTLALCAASTIIGLFGSVSDGHAQTITEFPIPTAKSTPIPITLGPDGALWFIEEACSDFNCDTNTAKIARITTTGVITEFPPSSDFLADIVTAPDGALWFPDDGCNGVPGCNPVTQVGRITTAGELSALPLPSPVGNFGGITVGPDGALWITDAMVGAAPSKIYLIHRFTLSGANTTFTVPNGRTDTDGKIIAGPDGALWFTEGHNSAQNGPDEIGRITTAGAITQFPVPTQAALVADIAVGADGALWFTEALGNKIGRITTSGAITEFLVPSSAAFPAGIVSGPDGALWFTEAACNQTGCPQGASAKIGRITLSGAITEYSLPTPGSAPLSITAGPDGALWFTENAGNKIGRITVPGFADPIVAAVLPSSRSIEVGGTATAFATMINAGQTTANGCAIVPVTSVPASFLYQTTDPTTNAVTGSPNTPVSIAAGRPQSFVIALTAAAAVVPTTVTLGFDCSGIDAAPSNTGLNTLLYSASATPVPDIVALAATANNDGTLHITGTSGSSAFAVATVNVGAGSAITATANTGSATLPLAIFLCQTNPQSGQCLAPPAANVSTTINANATPTFAFFATANGAVPFIPQTNRIFVQFSDATGVIRGSTSVAVETQ
jgi:virginiamycin B lyase